MAEKVNKNKDKHWVKKAVAEGESDTVSHKRIISLLSFIVLVILSGLSAFGFSATTEFIYMFGMLTGGESLLTTIEKTAGKITNSKRIIRSGKGDAEEIYED